MNGELKFRAWIIDEKTMTYDGFAMSTDGSFWQYADQGYYYNNLNASKEHKDFLVSKGIEIKDEFILMQYTGMKDNNGKEIYDRDLIRVYSPSGDEIFIGKLGFFPESGYAIFYKKDFIEFTTHLKYEVAGNEFENPELLNP